MQDRNPNLVAVSLLPPSVDNLLSLRNSLTLVRPTLALPGPQASSSYLWATAPPRGGTVEKWLAAGSSAPERAGPQESMDGWEGWTLSISETATRSWSRGILTRRGLRKCVAVGIDGGTAVPVCARPPELRQRVDSGRPRSRPRVEVRWEGLRAR